MKYITITDLNAAAYLQMHGIPAHVIPLQHQDARFRFPDSKDVNHYLDKYYHGKVEVNLQSFMYTRSVLKRENVMRLKEKFLKALTPSGETIPIARYAPHPRMPYWYTENNAVFNGVYSDTEPHLTRVKENRTFTNKRDDVDVKRDIYNQYFKDKYPVEVVIDDRPKVIRMWREEGLNVIDVGAGVEF